MDDEKRISPVRGYVDDNGVWVNVVFDWGDMLVHHLESYDKGETWLDRSDCPSCEGE